MIIKWKSLIFTIAFLVIATFSAQAMENPEDEKTRVSAFCKRYNLGEDVTMEVCDKVKGIAFELNGFGVPHLYFEAAYLFYYNRRVPGEFQLLYDVAAKMPKKNKKRKMGMSCLMTYTRAGTDPQFFEFYIDPEGKEVTNIANLITENLCMEEVKTFYEAKYKSLAYERAVELLIEKKVIKHLTEKLLELPYEPHKNPEDQSKSECSNL